MTGSRFFSAAAAMTFAALFLVFFGVISTIFIDIAFYVEAFAVLAVLTGVVLVSVERISRWGKPGSGYLT